MAAKMIKYGIILIIAVLLGVGYWLNGLPDVKYGIAAPVSNYKDITVNDKPAGCSGNDVKTEIPDSFAKVAGNDQLELYLEEESVAIAVKDKCNGHTWFSYDVSKDMEEAGYNAEMTAYIKSGLSIITYDKFTPGRRTILGDQATKTYQRRDDGFIATIDFEKAKIRFDVVVTLQQGDVVVQIPRESIKEYNANLWKAGNEDISLSEIIVYPFFGSATHKDNGYMVIPDGAGAIVKLDKTPKHAAGYSAPVYGTDPGYEGSMELSAKGVVVKPEERISLPIYGIIHDARHAGMLVIAESGDSYATYNYVSSGMQTNYYQSYFSYTYRKEYPQFQSRVNKDQLVLGFQEKPNSFDLVQRYVFLRGDQANYVGVAKTFRDFLVKKDGWHRPTAPKHDKMPMKIDFINNEVTDGTLGVENVTATSYKQAQEIVRKMADKGFSRLNVTFKSFIKKDAAYRFDVLRNLGGKEAFREAADYFASQHIKFNQYVDYSRSYFEATPYTASKLNRQAMGVINENKSVYNYLNNPKYFKVLAENDLKAYQQYGIHSLAFDGFGSSLFTHYDHGSIGYSNEGMAYVEDVLKYLGDNGIEIGMYLPDAYLYKYISEFYDTPISSSELIFIDATIPLVPLVVSGYADMYAPYMNSSSNDTDAMLRLIEFGVYPSFVLTGESTYSIKYTASHDVFTSELQYLEDRIDFYYSSASKALNEVIGHEMINHTILDAGVVLVEYDNGKKILINYNDSEYRYGDVKMKSKGFVIL
ncbi:DUF5696 domain-containing protein [Paenibacillus sp. KQZ6P-2]|uniref:DUF5696 domain-containing protein n=1 Tax=Paenibacillus mangrovi TaxID=2931978 RepID=A0A9X1WLT3_9BACL|nr:DUF5696 domain-containing protein [Paenibacillus mangrovi]MCJ8010856.1 DUF5696 domain-containing protein [Paenibacillus mangrovi]